MRRIALGIGIAVVLASGLWFGARHQATSEAMPVLSADADASARGAAAFIGADFGGLSLQALESHALPWKLVTAALVLKAVDEDTTRPADMSTLDDVLSGFGFLMQAQVMNVPDGVSAAPGKLPLGVTYGQLSPLAGAPVQVANLGCAACHAGVTYAADGQPDPRNAWIGMPNTSLNLEAYTLAIFRALKIYQADPDRLMAMVATLYPESGWRERQALRWLVLPLVRARLAQTPNDRPLPFSNGVPGSTNGVAALKHILDVPLIGQGAGDVGLVSIPDLGHRHWRSSLLVDGAYAVPDTARQGETTVGDITTERLAALAAITTFFTVPSMGVHPDKAITRLPVAEDIFAFLSAEYAPQPFPGAIDADLATAGAAIFATQCSACHGTYTLDGAPLKLASFPNWLGEVGTDPLRSDAFSQDLVEAFQDTPYRDRIAAKRTNAYVAPPLDGIWASAPYLHNGSVPTIWHLLTPKARPDRFELGGHALDFTRLGVRLTDGAYPPGYVPFSQSVTLDTAQPGLGNKGHTFGAALTEIEKSALIAFLKQL